METDGSRPRRSLLLPALHGSRRLPALILVLVVVATYGNTVLNDYALDDGMVITGNRYTTRGLAGIPDILTHDSLRGYLGRDNVFLPGGRYRPLSLVTFAVEYHVLGFNPGVSHLVNVGLYALVAVSAWLLLRRVVFPDRPLLAFAAAVLFAVHPIHTEAVANVKSRDEILSLLFLLVALLGLLRYAERPRLRHLVLSLSCYGLALLAKENGLTFLAIVPLTLVCFTDSTPTRVARLTLPFVLVAAVYGVLHVAFAGFRLEEDAYRDVLNIPYLYASWAQKYATVVYVLGRYLRLLVVPYPLSWDYSYPDIPYLRFSSPAVLVSLALHLFLVGWSFVHLRTQRVVAYGILFYLCSLFIVSNILVNIGTFMGERFAFQGSFGFVIAVCATTAGLADRAGRRARGVLTAAVGLLVLLWGGQIMARNADWKTNETLFLADLEAAPNSAKTNQGYGSALIEDAKRTDDPARRRQTVEEAIVYLKRAVELHPRYYDAYLALSTAYYILQRPDLMELQLNHVRRIVPHHPLLKGHERFLAKALLAQALEATRDARLDGAVVLLRQAIAYDDVSHTAHHQLGVVYGILEDHGRSIAHLQRAVRLDPDSARYWVSLSRAYAAVEAYEEARAAWERSVALDAADPGGQGRIGSGAR